MQFFASNIRAINAALVFHEILENDKKMTNNISRKVDFIYWYATVDVALSAASRIFMLYCTWYFIKIYRSPERLSLLLIVVWIVSTLALLAPNLFSHKYGYVRTVKIICYTFLSAIILYITIFFTFLDTNKHILFNIILLSIVGVIVSASTSMLSTLSNPIITIASSNPLDLERRIKVLTNTFFINLLLGTLAGSFFINLYGVYSAIILGVTLAILGTVSSILFSEIFKKTDSPDNEKYKNVFVELKNGLNCVIKTPPERSIAFISMILNMVITPVIFFLFPLAILGSGHSVLIVALVEVTAGIGMMIASSVGLKWFNKMFRPYTVFSLSIIFVIISLLIFLLYKSLSSLFISAFIIGFGIAFYNIVSNTKRMQAIPVNKLPNMESLLLFLSTASIPLGFFICKEFASGDNVIIVLNIFIISLSLALLISLSSTPLRLMLNDNHDDETKYYERIYSDIYR